MEVLLIAYPTDDLAAAFAAHVESQGACASCLDIEGAAQTLTIELTHGKVGVVPSVPILFRPQVAVARRKSFDQEFTYGEALATVWSAVALTEARVVNRPGPQGLLQGMSDSPALNEARAGLQGRPEIYCRSLEIIEPDDNPVWAVDLHACTVSALPNAPPGVGPYRLRPGVVNPGYEEVVVVGERAWRRSHLRLGGAGIEEESIRALRNLNLDFGVVTWFVNVSGVDPHIAGVSHHPTMDQVREHWGDIATALQELLAA